MKNIFSYAGLLLVIILTGCHSVPEPTIVNIETFQPNPNYPLAEFAAPLSDQEAWDAEGWQEATENGISTWTTQSGTAKSLGAHQDLELHLELKLSPGSSLEIRLQNAYPLVIHADASAEGHAVISGIAPSRETGRKPGLWQSIDIHFEAPVNDQMVQLPARISQINLNGIPIHEEVLLPASNTEGAGRLILQATGELSLRNLALKRLDRVTSSTSQMAQPLIPAGSIKYQYFEKEAWSQLSMFDGLAARSSGTSDLMDIKGHSKQQSDYGLIYTAHFTVPAAGTYVFLLTSDDGSKLTIDGDVRIINDGLHADETVTDTIALEAGDHEAVIHYFQGSGGASLRLDYTGEGLEVIPLFSPKKGEVVKKSTISYLIEPESEPIVQRGFLIYPPRQKLGFKETPARITHGVSVGDPGGNHFAVNAGQGTLLMFWHGEFADMANMWEGRGEWQNLSPMGDLVDRSGAPDFALLSDPASFWPDSVGENHSIQAKGYGLNEQGWPTFDYKMGNTTIEDGYQADKSGIIRTTKIAENDVPIFHMVASGSAIENLGKGNYAIQGPGYLAQIKACQGCEIFLRQTAAGQELVASIAPGGGNITTAFSW